MTIRGAPISQASTNTRGARSRIGACGRSMPRLRLGALEDAGLEPLGCRRVLSAIRRPASARSRWPNTSIFIPASLIRQKRVAPRTWSMSAMLRQPSRRDTARWPSSRWRGWPAPADRHRGPGRRGRRKPPSSPRGACRRWPGTPSPPSATCTSSARPAPSWPRSRSAASLHAQHNPHALLAHPGCHGGGGARTHP